MVIRINGLNEYHSARALSKRKGGFERQDKGAIDENAEGWPIKKP
jgi:hypothetical protein